MLVRIGLDASSLDSGLSSATRTLDDFASRASKAGLALTAGVTAPLLAIGKASLDSAVTMDGLMRGLTAVSGGAEKAATQFEKLREVAKLPGLTLESAVQGAVSLQAAGMSAQLAQRSLMAFGNALATVGRSGSADMGLVNLALTQIASKSRVSAQEINQLSERIPQIRAAMQAAFGTADTEQLAKLGIGPKQFIEGIITELEKLPKVTGGIGNTLENLKDSVKIAFADIGKALIPFVEQFVTVAVPAIQTVVGAFTSLPEPLQNAAIIFATAAAAAGPLLLALGGMASGLSALIGLAPGLSTLAGALGLGTGLAGALSLAVPLAAALGVAIAGWAIYAAVTQLRQLNAELDRTYAEFGKGTRATKAQSDEIGVLETALRRAGKDPAAIQQAIRNSGKALTADNYLPALREAAKAGAQPIDLGKLSITRGPGGGLILGGGGASGVSQADALKLFGLSSTAQLQADLAKAKEALATLKAGGQAPGVIAAAQAEVDRLAASLNGPLKTGLEKTMILMKAIPFAEKSLEGKLLAAEVGALSREHEALVKHLGTLRLEMAQGKVTSSIFGIDLPTLDLALNKAENLARVAKSINLAALGTNPAQAMDAQRLDDLLRFNSTAGRRADEAINYGYSKSSNLGQRGFDLITYGQSDALKKGLQEASEAAKDMERNVRKAFDNMARGMAESLIEWKGFGETLKNIGKEFLTGIAEIGIKSLLNPLKEGLTSFFTGEGGTGGLFGGLSQMFSGLGGKLKGLLGFGGAAGGGGAGGASGLLGSLGGLAGSANPVGMIAGAAGAISSVVGNFQMAKLESTMNAVEKETRESKIHLSYILEKVNENLPGIKDIHGYLWDAQLTILTSIDSYLQTLIDRGQQILDAMRSGFVAGSANADGSVEIAASAWDVLVEAVHEVRDAIKAAHTEINESLIKAFNLQAPEPSVAVEPVEETPEPVAETLSEAINEQGTFTGPAEILTSDKITNYATLGVREVVQAIADLAATVVAQFDRLFEFLGGIAEQTTKAAEAQTAAVQEAVAGEYGPLDESLFGLTDVLGGAVPQFTAAIENTAQIWQDTGALVIDQMGAQGEATSAALYTATATMAKVANATLGPGADLEIDSFAGPGNPGPLSQAGTGELGEFSLTDYASVPTDPYLPVAPRTNTPFAAPGGGAPVNVTINQPWIENEFLIDRLVNRIARRLQEAGVPAY